MEQAPSLESLMIQKLIMAILKIITFLTQNKHTSNNISQQHLPTTSISNKYPFIWLVSFSSIKSHKINDIILHNNIWPKSIQAYANPLRKVSNIIMQIIENIEVNIIIGSKAVSKILLKIIQDR